MRRVRVKRIAATGLLFMAPVAAIAGPIAYQPKHVSAADLPAFTDMPADAKRAAGGERAELAIADEAGNQVPAPASLGIFALAATGILGTRARRRRIG